MRAFNVYLDGEMIDTVFYNNNAKVDEDEVRDSLIYHDGYPCNIYVEEEESSVEVTFGTRL